jgi:hypothetical protein
MARKEYIRSAAAMQSMKFFPERIRDALVSDNSFRDKYHLKADAEVSVGQGGIAFRRSLLFEAVRAALSGPEISPVVKDGLEENWTVEALSDADTIGRVALVQPTRRLILTYFALLSPDANVRLKTFQADADRVNLPAADREKWETLLATRPPDDDEIGVLQDDLNATPISVSHRIRDELSRGSASIECLVPDSIIYYERLVGRFVEGLNFDKYVKEVASPFLKQLVEWNGVEGFKLALLLGSQPVLAAAIMQQEISDADRQTVIDWLCNHGDLQSCATIVEGSFRWVEASPALVEPLTRLVTLLAGNDAKSPVARSALFSSLFVFVYGVSSLRRLFPDRPPYWRRLAALAQAALVERCVIECSVASESFGNWARNAGAEAFYLQTFADMRLEPRWLPDLASSDQIKSEFAGRILSAATAHAATVAAVGWTGLLLDEIEGSVRHHVNIARAFMPGPLEGSLEAALSIPEALLEEMRADLSAERITARASAVLANAPLLFRIPADFADNAAEALKRADYRLELETDETSIEPFLLGLASVASATRSHPLADALFILIRRYRALFPSELDPDDALRIGLIASASRTDLTAWCVCVGECMNSIAFQELSSKDADSMLSHLHKLCHLVPELWATCGQAEAALRAILKA